MQQFLHDRNMQARLRRVGLLMLIGLLAEVPAYALSKVQAGKSQLRGISRLVAGKRWQQDLSGIPLRLHAFEDGSAGLGLTAEEAYSQIWGRLRKGQLGFANAVEELVRSRLPNAHMQLKPVALTTPLFNLDRHKQPVQQAAFRFAFGGVALCDYEVKGTYRPGQRPFVLGQLPRINAEAAPQALDNWPTLAESRARLRLELQQELNHTQGADASRAHPAAVKVTAAERCYHIADGRPLPAWELKAKDEEGLSYRVIVGKEAVYQLAGLFFDLEDTTDGSVQAYDSNPIDGQLQVFSTKLTGEGTLTSELFATVPNANPSASVDRAFEENHEFIYEPSDARFAEASAYIHTVQMYEYFQTLGYSWHGNKPLNIRLHVVLSNTKNNALYEPDRDGQPAISIGDGDGVGLRNLALDADVVSHEFGHHVVYRSLKSTVGESLVLHEGLADFFAFTKTGDTCLGESICPADSNYCVVKDKCLRTANNDLSYESTSYNAVGAHLKGQLVSGMLWDLRSSLDPVYVTKIVFRALDYFVSSSGYADFIIALMQADKDFEDAKNACTIFAGAEARGLAKVLSGIDCTKQETWIRSDSDAERPSSSPTTEDDGQSKKKDKGIFGCGSLPLAGGPDDHGNGQGRLPLMLFLLWTLPLWICGRRIFAQRRAASWPYPALAALLLLGVLYCPPLLAGSKAPGNHSALLQTTAEHAGVLVALSVVWEGERLDKVNLDALAAFRAQHPDLRFIQFLNPAYFTKNGITPHEVVSHIKRVIHPDDTSGLHLHAWKNFVEASGVEFRQGPTFWGQSLTPQRCMSDCGHEVPLSIYTEDEIEVMLKHGAKLLGEAGLPAPEAFMAGGWMAAPHVLEALARTAMRYDFSPVPAALVKAELQYYPLYDWLVHLWPGLHPLSQPSLYYTSQGELTQVVSNGASIDYRSAEEILQWYKEAASLWQKDPHTQVVLHLSLYQESAFQFVPRLNQVVAGIASYNAEHKIPMRYMQTLKDIPTPLHNESHAPAVSLRPLQWERGL